MCLNPAQKSSRLTATFGFERTCFPVFKRSCRGKTLLKIILFFYLLYPRWIHSIMSFLDTNESAKRRERRLRLKDWRRSTQSDIILLSGLELTSNTYGSLDILS